MAKRRIPVPGADYVIGFSMFSIYEDGKLGPETDKGSWEF